MVIENKWVVFETRTGMYYAGNNENGRPDPEPLSGKTRQYRTQRAANCAIDRISEISEGYNFVAKHIEQKEVPDADENTDKHMNRMAEVTDAAGWKEVYGFAVPGTDKFAKIKLCLKELNGIEIFGVKKSDGKLYSAGFNGGEAALKCFCKECYGYLLPRVTQQKGRYKYGSCKLSRLRDR